MSHRLTYDTLPAHSQLHREYADGVVKIIAAPEEPGPLVRRAALRRSALPAALIWFATIVVGFAVFGATYLSHRPFMPDWMSLALGIAFTVFCVALFLLAWRIHYAARLSAAQRALRQSTVLAASPGRLLIETSGPTGTARYDLKHSVAAPSIRTFRRGRCELDRPVDCLEIVLSDGTLIHVLPG